MFENLYKKLKEENIEYKEEMVDGDLKVTFDIEILNDTLPCAFIYNEEDRLVGFFMDLVEFDNESTEDGFALANDINLNSTFLKSYLDDNNVLCVEYFWDASNGIPMDLIEDILNDLWSSEEYINQYI